VFVVHQACYPAFAFARPNDADVIENLLKLGGGSAALSGPLSPLSAISSDSKDDQF
jgi:hypothetical protein